MVRNALRCIVETRYYYCSECEWLYLRRTSVARCLEVRQWQHGDVEINRPAVAKSGSLLLIPSLEEKLTGMEGSMSKVVSVKDRPGSNC